LTYVTIEMDYTMPGLLLSDGRKGGVPSWKIKKITCKTQYVQLDHQTLMNWTRERPQAKTRDSLFKERTILVYIE